MSRQNLEQFKKLVLRKTDLQEQLKQAANEQEFIQLIVNLGQEKGYDFTDEEVAISLQEQRQALENMTFGERTIRNLRAEWQPRVGGLRAVIWGGGDRL